MVGQSFHLFGANSAAIADIHNTGLGTGLEGARSDLVASLTATGSRGTSLALNGRFDGMTYALRRGTMALNAELGPVSATAGLGYDRTLRDLEGNPTATATVMAEAAIAINPHWTLAGGFGYDFVSGTLTSDFVRLVYECDCAALTLTFEETRDPGAPGVERTILFGLELRTLGDFDIARRNN
jgi:LPS-assembly protein